MKRSEINSIMRSAKQFLAEYQFHLSPFAAWTPDAWRAKSLEVS
jgi:D-lyxose ketol-isomerase